MPKRDVRVGQISGAFGLKGHVKVAPLTEFAERFEAGSTLQLDNRAVKIESFSIHKGKPLLKLSGIDDATAAESIRGKYLVAVGVDAPELEEDEYLISDLVGLQVKTKEGELLGNVQSVLPYPAHDVLQVGEILIPVVKQFVKDVDLKAKQITVELIYGMRPGED